MNFRFLILLIVLAFIMFSCESPHVTGTDPTPAGDAAIFDLPPSMTGSSGSKTIDTSTVGIINDFFNYGRHQLDIANFWADQVKRMINDLEAAGLFTSNSDLVHEFTGVENNGDIVRWTTGPGSEEYFLEWWKKQADTSYQKFFELKFNHYSSSTDAVVVRGWAIIDLAADATITSSGYTQLPAFVKVEFDSAKADLSGQKWIRVSMTDFQITAAGNLQNSQIEAWKDSSGTITLKAAVSVPQITLLNYGGTAEDRFYLITGKGNSTKATVQLGMPLGNYDATSFASNLTTLNTVGDTIAEYYADMLRANAVIGSTTGDAILAALTSNTSYTLDNTSSTTDIRGAFIELGPASDEVDDLYLLMTIANPVYFQSGGYESFGSTVPTGYRDPSEIPGGADLISRTALLALSTSIDFTVPSDTPPSP